MDYGVTREMVERIQAEVAELKNEYQDDKYIGRLLKMIDSLVRHIKKRKSDAHPASLDLLHSVFDCLEDLVLIPEIADDSKKKMVKVQTEKFKELKEELSLHAGEEKGVKSGVLEKRVEKDPPSDDRSVPDLFEDSPEDTLTAESEASAESEVEPLPEPGEMPGSDEDLASLGPDETSEAVGLEEFDLTEADEAPVLDELLNELPPDEVKIFEPPKRPHIHPLEAVVSNETDTDTQIIIRGSEQESPESPMEEEPVDSLTRLEYTEDTEVELRDVVAEEEAIDEPQVVLSSFIEENQDVDGLVDSGPSMMADRLVQAVQGKAKHERGDWISTSDLIPEEFRTKEPAGDEVEVQTEENPDAEHLEDTQTDIKMLDHWRDREKTGEIDKAPEIDPEMKAISDRVERLYDKWATIGDDTTTKILSQLGIDSEVLKGPDDQTAGPDSEEIETIDTTPETMVEAGREPDYSGLHGESEAESEPVDYRDPGESAGPIPDKIFVSDREPEDMGLATQEFEIGEHTAEPAPPEQSGEETAELESAGAENGLEVLSDVPTSAYDLEALGPDVIHVAAGSVGGDEAEQSGQGPDQFKERVYGESSPIVSGVSPHEILAFTLHEIKQAIRAEFQALAAELRLWRNTK